MAVYSSWLLIVAFFLCIMAAHAVRDLPDQASIRIEMHNNTGKLTGMTKVATLPSGGVSVSWAGDCFQSNTGFLSIEGPTATVFITASKAKSWSCSDFYEFWSTDNVKLDHLSIFKSGSHFDVLDIGGVPEPVKNNGVIVKVDIGRNARIKALEEASAAI